jgi:hypothetical protein
MKNTSDQSSKSNASSLLDCFGRQTLELSFRLIRQRDKLLAHSIKQVIDKLDDKQVDESSHTLTKVLYPNSLLLALMDAETVGKIIACLTQIGEEALVYKNLPPVHLKQLQSIINDWAQLTEWVLQHIDKRYLNLSQTKKANS